MKRDANHQEKGDHSGTRFDLEPCMNTYTNNKLYIQGPNIGTVYLYVFVTLA